MLFGIDRLGASDLTPVRQRLRDGGVAVLTHAAAADRRGRHLLDVLDELGVEARVLFTPEHGFEADAQAEASVATESAGPSHGEGLRVISLYGESQDSLSPKPEHFEGIDVLLVDMVDVGSRYYTYVWTALLAARAAAAAGVHTLVLDRANPIGGDPALCEGAAQDGDHLSFVGLEPVPIRHGLTVGEILCMLFERDGKPLGPEGALSVVATLGWERFRTAHAWGRPFLPPSPNMPTADTALVYPGGCLVEGTNLSEGRGTTLPFHLVGAPFLDGRRLAEAMTEAALPGLQIRPVAFVPTFEKHAGKRCRGVMLHVTDMAAFRPVMTYLTLVALAREQAPDDFAFRTEPYEFEKERPAFDLLTGSTRARQAMIDGASPSVVCELVSPVAAEWGAELRSAEARLERAGA